MRIAVIFDSFGPYHIARLAAASRRAEILGVEVARQSKDYSWAPINGSVGFRRETLLENGTSDRADNRIVSERLWKVLSAFCPDAVAIPGWSSRAAFLALHWCLRRGIAAVLMSESQAIDKPRFAVKEWTKRCYLRAFASALVGGRSHRDYLNGLGMRNEHIFFGYDAVDNEYFSQGAATARRYSNETRQTLALPQNYFLAANRFIRKKNLPVLLRAFARHRAQVTVPHWDLVLLGDGPLRCELVSLTRELGLEECVRLPGFQQYNILPSYYGLAGAFVHSSATEQWGLVVNEAMASGLPVLVSNRCGCAKDLVIHGETGFLFDPTDDRMIADQMTRIAGDERCRKALGDCSRELIRDWGTDRFANGILAAAECAVRAPAKPPPFLDKLILHVLAMKPA